MNNDYNNMNHNYYQGDQNYNYMNNYNYSYNNQSPKKNGINKELIIAIIGLVIVLIGIIITFVIISNKEAENSKKDNIEEKSNNGVQNNTITIGSKEYGYLDIPNDWTKFEDTQENNSIQYSTKDRRYIISLDIIEDNSHSAKEYASNFLYLKQQDSEATGVTGATVTVGQNKEYTAYQIYMVYPNLGKYLVTYWFEAEDGNTHYIALEGPEEKIMDYVSIPDTYRLKDNSEMALAKDFLQTK